ncbi:MAG TPA: heme o synthase, partial [Rhodanobacteraceae bacterium]|nr:heme o synthase [Rhodanobacteraceae bacterium]
LCIAIGAGASGALNMWYDADIDAVMTRTKRRPIPAGRVQPGEALAFGATLAVFSTATLGVLVNWFAAALLAFTIFFYVFVYTMWLKRSTPQNIVIGGAAGAFPPMIGWAAVTGDVSLAPFLMFLIIFLWTPPHFWALSLIKSDDYARAGVPMLPVVAGKAETKKQMLLYTLVLWPVAVAPTLLHATGWLYGAAALVLSVLFTLCALAVWRDAGDRAARRMFGFSLLYLFLLFALMAIDRAPGLFPVPGFGA